MEYSRARYEEDKLDKSRINLLIHFLSMRKWQCMSIYIIFNRNVNKYKISDGNIPYLFILFYNN